MKQARFTPRDINGKATGAGRSTGVRKSVGRGVHHGNEDYWWNRKDCGLYNFGHLAHLEKALSNNEEYYNSLMPEDE